VQLEKQQRMAPEVEEIRVDGDAVDFEKLLPEDREASLEITSRRCAGRGGRGRRACGAACGCREDALPAGDGDVRSFRECREEAVKLGESHAGLVGADPRAVIEDLQA